MIILTCIYLAGGWAFLLWYAGRHFDDIDASVAPGVGVVLFAFWPVWLLVGFADAVKRWVDTK